MVNSFREPDVHKMGMDGAMQTFRIRASFPPEERYSLTDQIQSIDSSKLCFGVTVFPRPLRQRAEPAPYLIRG
jgi:hypothetical protein